jgi:hypothetical protein
LFNVGVPDIPQLSGPSWIACTTDDLLATKPELFDVLVVLPPAHAKKAARNVFPKLVESSPSLSRSFSRVGLKATRRDARRYQTLEREQVLGLLRADTKVMKPTTPVVNVYCDQEISWEFALVLYFHRLTRLMFRTISDAIKRHDGDEMKRDVKMATGGYRLIKGGDGQHEPIEILQEDMTTMGLDIWSTADRIVVEELVKVWWGRTATFNRRRVECYGVRLLRRSTALLYSSKVSSLIY